MAVFPITISPDAPFEHTVKPRVREVSFGDGYGQVCADGLNDFLVTSASPMWSNLSLSELQTAETFLKNLKGASFQWISPIHGSSRNWRLVEYTPNASRTQFMLKMTIKEIP